MSRRMNLVFALGALVIMSGLAIGQTASRSITTAEQTMQARIPPRGGNPSDPCSPWFTGTVLVPCNTTVGSLIWNEGSRRYDVRLDESLLKQAYAYVAQQTRVDAAAAKRPVPPPYDRWVEMLKDMFGQRVSQVFPPGTQNPPLTNGTAKERPPVKIDLKLDVNQKGEVSGGLHLSVTI